MEAISEWANPVTNQTHLPPPGEWPHCKRGGGEGGVGEGGEGGEGGGGNGTGGEGME